MNSVDNDNFHVEEWFSVIVPFPEREGYGAEPYQWLDASWKPCLDWCRERFEHGPDREIDWSYSGGGRFEFQREEDAVLFTLRWL